MVAVTAGTLSKSDSTHQKQPPAKVATAWPGGAGVPGDCAKGAGAANASARVIRMRRIADSPSLGCMMSRTRRPTLTDSIVPQSRGAKHAARVSMGGRREARPDLVREDVLAPAARNA